MVHQLLDDGAIGGRADDNVTIRHILGVPDAHQIAIIKGWLHTCTGHTDQSISGFVVPGLFYEHILRGQINEITAGAGSRRRGLQRNKVIGFFQVSVAGVYFLLQHGVDGFIDDLLSDTA